MENIRHNAYVIASTAATTIATVVQESIPVALCGAVR